jgi:hypothetical protein
MHFLDIIKQNINKLRTQIVVVNFGHQYRLTYLNY